MTRLDSPDSVVKWWTSCSGCDKKLPLRLSARGEEAGLWVCTHCKRAFAGIYVREAPKHYAPRVRFADAHFDADESPPVSPAMITAAVELANRANEFHHELERRSERRRIYGLKAVVMRLNSGFCPVGRPINVYVHNLSASGLGFTASELLDSKWIAIEMARENVRVQMVAEVIHYKPFADEFYQAGARFLIRLG